MWHKFSNIFTDSFDEYPPEGITVKVTDGRTIDEAYFIYSGFYRWFKIDEVEMTIQPSHYQRRNKITNNKGTCKNNKQDKISYQGISN